LSILLYSQAFKAYYFNYPYTMSNRSKQKIVNFKTLSILLVLIFVFSIIFFSGNTKVFKHLSLSGTQFSSIISGVLNSNTNQYRQDNKINELVVSDVLSRAAQMKADDMATKGYFSHIGLNGEEPWSWFRKAGYNYEYAGENLAIDFTESDDVSQAWIGSALHNANLLNPNFTEIGVGIAEGVYDGSKTTFVVQFFGTPIKPGLENENTDVTEQLHEFVNPEMPIVTRNGIPQGEVLGIYDSFDNKNKFYPIIFFVPFLTLIFYFVYKYRTK